MHLKNSYRHTLYACYAGYVTQAVVNNFAPLLFVVFQTEYSIPLSMITMLISVNFGIQLLVDLLAAKFIDKIGYRISIVAAHFFVAAGLIGLGVLPELIRNHYIGILISVCVYAVGGGLLEVLVSPITEACPTDNKSGIMSMLHSFYCWGSVIVIAFSTIFFYAFGIENWRGISIIWSLLPVCNGIYFMMVSINKLTEEGSALSFKELFSVKIFWIFVLLIASAGASEQAMSQWASNFAETGLGITKTAGDIAGPCFFAVCMGSSRLIYAKFSEHMDLKRTMLLSGGLCIISYMLSSLSVNPVLALVGCGMCGLSVGVLWPGTFSLAAANCRRGGTAMFAILALAGDLGCVAGPTVVGAVSGIFENNLRTGLLAAIIFPIMLIFGIIFLKRMLNSKHSVT